jgi:hypothetical protein
MLSGVFASLGRFVYRRRVPVVLAWVLLLGVGLGVGPEVFGRLGTGSGLRDDAESVVVSDLLSRAAGGGSEITGLVDGRSIDDPAFRAELAAWTGRSPDRPDGVPVTAAGPLPAPQDRWVLRDFTAGAGRDRVAGKDFENEPLIAVVTATFSGVPGHVQAGEALQRVLLTATVEGLAVSFLSQLVEVPDVCDAVQRLLTTIRPPQVVLRIGHGWPTTRTARRAAADLLVEPDDAAGG